LETSLKKVLIQGQTCRTLPRFNQSIRRYHQLKN